MISIIVSSHNDKYFKLFEINVAKTVGAEYEIIKVHNPGVMGICEAYNIGAQKAKFPILCFSHEDIEMKSEKWGEKLVSIFSSNREVGIIGIGGASFKAWMPSGWWAFNPEKKFLYLNVIQSDVKRNNESVVEIINPHNKDMQEVVVVDGCWFCTTKEIAMEMKFDQSTFTDYHCYDMDFSLTVGQKYKIFVTFEIFLEHFSRGSFSKSWVLETFKLFEKWNKKTPISCETMTKKERQKEEIGSFRFLVRKSKEVNVDVKRSLSFQYKWQFMKAVGLKNWIINQVWIFRELFFWIIKKNRI